VPLVSEDSENKLEILAVVLSDCRTVMIHGKNCLEAPVGRRYGSPTCQDPIELKPIGCLVGVVCPQNYGETGMSEALPILVQAWQMPHNNTTLMPLLHLQMVIMVLGPMIWILPLTLKLVPGVGLQS
jgi:hypothetical protein